MGGQPGSQQAQRHGPVDLGLPEAARHLGHIVRAGPVVVLGEALHRMVQQHERRESAGRRRHVPPADTVRRVHPGRRQAVERLCGNERGLAGREQAEHHQGGAGHAGNASMLPGRGMPTR